MIRECHRGHVDPRAHDGRSRADLHVQRPARREDGLARQAVGGPRARAEQPGLGHRAQRHAARGPAGRGRAGDARARRGPPDRRAARRVDARPRVVPGHRACSGVRSPLEQAEREEAIADWLDDHGLDAAHRRRAGRDGRDASRRSIGSPRAVDGPALDAVLRWAAAGCSVRELASEIQDAAMRISGLVLAIKGFTHMDQATVAEPVDLRPGSATPSPSSSRRRGPSRRRWPSRSSRTCRRVRGFVGELNQIWANLIDNALDAIAEAGPRRRAAPARERSARGGAHRRQRPRHPGTRSAPASSIRSSPRSRSARAPGSASTSSGGWSGTTTARSRSSRGPGRTEFRVVAAASPTPTTAGGTLVNKPVLLVVDDDPQVLAAVRRDLRIRVPRALHRRQRGLGAGGARHRARAEEPAATRWRWSSATSACRACSAPRCWRARARFTRWRGACC